MKNLKFLTALLVLLVLQSCENEEVNQFEEISEIQETVGTSNSDKLELQSLTTEQVPQFTKGLEKKSKNSKIGWTSKTGPGSMILDETRILKVTDSVGNNTYSARMYVSDTPYNVFYNVVAQETSDGDMSEPMILRYEVDIDYYPTYKNSSRKDTPFKGNIEVIAWDSFTKGSSVSGKAPIYQPCDRFTAEGNNYDPSLSPNGGGNARNNTDNTSGNTYAGPATGGYGVYAVVTDSRGGRGTTGSVEVGKGRFGTFGTDGESEGGSECNDQNGDTGKDNKDCGKAPEKGDCPDILLLIPVNEYEDHVHLEEEVKNPCVKNILEKLQRKDMQNLTVPDIGGLDGTGHLSQGILDLFDGFDNLDLTFKVDEAGSGKNAATIPVVSGGNAGIVTTLDEEFVENATQLAVARTIIHESVHAYLLFVTGHKSTSNTSEVLRDYRKKYDNSLDMAHHEYMAQFVEAIGKSLSVWDNNRQSQEYYNNLAWSGNMLTSEEFKKLTPKEQKAIKDANIAEGNAINKATNRAKGKKCK